MNNPEEKKKNDKMQRILIAGGDGFIGWPLALRLSKLGH